MESASHFYSSGRFENDLLSNARSNQKLIFIFAGMSYESELNNQPSKFIKPTQLAFILSIILHLLVYRFGLPTLNFKNDSGRRQVAVIELDSSQQSRLPNLYPELDIPQVPNIPPDDSLPAPPFALPPGLTPGINGIPNLPPVVIPPPPNFDIPPLPPFPPSTNIKLPPIGDLSSLPLPPPLESLDFKPQNPPDQPANNSSKTPSSTEQPSQTTPETEQKPEAQPEGEPDKKPKLEPSPQEIAAKRQQNLQQEVRRISGSLQKDGTGTSNDDANRNYLAWWNRIQTDKPEEITLKGTYPRDACIRRLEGESAFGILVNAEGTVVSGALIKGSKYPIFNEQGSKDISKTDFAKLTTETQATEETKPTSETQPTEDIQPTKETKPYLVTVDYKYDAETCPSLTLPSLRRENKSEEDTSQPKDTPQPTEATPEKPQSETETPSKPEPVTPEKPLEPASKPVPPPKPKPAPKPPAPKPKPPSQPAPPPLPSLRDRLRDVPLPDRKPADFQNTPLPDKPRF